MVSASSAPSSVRRAVSVLVPTGTLGADVIAVDGGSTDSGPYYLGAGEAKTADAAVRRDLRILLSAAHRASIPLIVGSCGTSGTDSGVDWVSGIVREICAEDALDLPIAEIY